MNQTTPSKMELSRHLVTLLRDCEDIFGAVVATSDGHAVAHYGRDGDKMPAKQLAAMSSTLVALGDSVAKVLEQGICTNVLVENDQGTALVLHAGEGMVLMTAAVSNAKLGMVLSHSRKCATSIAETGMSVS